MLTRARHVITRAVMKANLIQMRIDDAEKERFREFARALGLSLSEWVLALCRRELTTQTTQGTTHV